MNRRLLAMNESSVRAERFDRDAPASPAYTWTVPQKPVAVQIPVELMEKLEREAVENYRSLTSRGSEIGGVLFGTVTPGNPALVEIESYESVPCEYAVGPLYRLTEPELVRLDQAVGQKRANGIEPVGFFRSHTRKGLSLDASDLAVLDSRFSGPHQIALVIRPSATKASTGGIFIRENGTVRGEASYLEFPLRVSRDGAAKHSAAPEGEVAGPRAVPAAPAVPAAAKPVARAQIVPIATRREIMPMPAPTVAPAPDPTVEEPKTEEKAPAPEAAAPVPPPAQPAVPAAAPAAAAAAAEPVAKAQKTEPAGAPESRPAETDDGMFRSFEQPAPRRSGKWLWIAIGTLVPAALAAGFFLSSGVLNLRRPALPPATAEAGLALRIERNAGDILLTWNRDADAIRRATKAVLQISDGTQQENVAMDLNQLRTGSIVYTPVTSDVVFQMQVTADGQAEPVSETVRVLRTRPSPMPDGTQAGAPAAAGAKPAPPAAAGAEQAGAEVAPADEKVAIAHPVKAFRTESLAQRLRPARPTELPDAPLVAAAPASGVPDVNLGGIVSSPVAPPPPAPKVEPVTKAPSMGGQVQAAVLIQRVNPEFPNMARQAGASGAVEVVATIGTDGHVKNVHALSGNPLLRAAAIAAVKQWVYRPTLLNGQPVESETKVVLDFKTMR
jgi:periplasmic protein TonB